MKFLDNNFAKNLDDWLANNKQPAAKYLQKISNSLPATLKQGGKLYRGMSVDTSFLNEVNSGKMIFSNPTSWSRDKNVAMKFISDPKFKVGGSSGTVKIIIEKDITSSDVVLDIFSLVMVTDSLLITMGVDELSIDSAFKEKEVLIKSGIKILPKEVTFV